MNTAPSKTATSCVVGGQLPPGAVPHENPRSVRVPAGVGVGAHALGAGHCCDLGADHSTKHEQLVERTIQEAFDRMLAAANDHDRREAGDEFVRLIVMRNSGRSEACIAALEAAKGLR